MRRIFTEIAFAAAILASSAALAQETSASGIKVNKYASCENGLGEITIEAFATSPVIKTGPESHLPADIVLLLDVSGSMDDKISFNGKTEVTSGTLTVGQTYKVVIDSKEYYLKGFQTSSSSTGYTAKYDNWTYDKVNGNTYYYKDGNSYYLVYTEKNGSKYRLYYLKPKSYYKYEKVYISNNKMSTNGMFDWFFGGDDNDNDNDNDDKNSKGGDGASSSTSTIYTGNLYVKGGTEGGNYIYRYGSSEPSNSSSGSEFYKGSTNFSVGSDASVSNYKIYTTSSTSMTKINALKTSVKGFISHIAADSRSSGIEHRISLIKFAGTTTNDIGNSKYERSQYNYTQIMTGFVSAKDNETSLLNMVEALTSGGGTRASDGMVHAQDVIIGNSSRNLQGSDAYYSGKNIEEYAKVLVLFTDGEPGDYGFSSSYRGNNDYSNGWNVANKTIAASKVIKDSGARVYTIGLLSAGEDAEHYLELTSSDYPTAETGFTYNSRSCSQVTTYPQKSIGYCNITSGDDLSDIFQDIAYESYTGHADYVELDASTILDDIIDPDFKLPEGSTVQDIKVYVAKCTERIPDDDYPLEDDLASYSFSDELCQVFGQGTGSIITPDPASPGFGSITATIGKSGEMDKIDVTGFSFKDYWCGLDESTSSLRAGYKIIVKIPFVIDKYHEDRSVYETNESESGIYTGEGTKVIGFPIPNLYSIIIVKNGLKEGESAIFNIYRHDGSAWSETPAYTTMIIGDSDEETADVQVIAAIEDGLYKVVEDNAWSWTYENATPSVEHGLSDSERVTFEFTNSKKSLGEGEKVILNAEATVVNEMGSN